MRRTLIDEHQFGYDAKIQDAYEQIMALEKAKAISKYTLPKKPSSDNQYHIYVNDPTKKSGRKQIKAKTLDELIDKVYNHEKGIHGSHPKTFKEAYALWKEDKMKYIKDPERLLSANNSIGVLDTTYKRFFEGTKFERMKIEDIRKNDIEEFCYNILNDNELQITKKCFLGFRGIIKNVLQYGYNQYWIVDNPYMRIDFKKYNDMLKQPVPIAKRVHSDEDIDRMFDYIHEYQKNKPTYVPGWALELQMLMGLRRGEVPPLRWSDVKDTFISITREQITVKKSADNPSDYYKIVEHTKTYVDRVFPITKDIRDFLNRLKAMLDIHYPGTEFLFPCETTLEGVIGNQSVYKFYERMCKNLKIEISREFTKGTHAFRRTGITKVANASGGSLVLAAKLFGNSPNIAEKHYYSGINVEEAKNILEA